MGLCRGCGRLANDFCVSPFTRSDLVTWPLLEFRADDLIHMCSIICDFEVRVHDLNARTYLAQHGVFSTSFIWEPSEMLGAQ